MHITRTLAVALATSMLAAALPSVAAPVVSTGYDMPNGGGQTSGGSYNYWDLAYSGSGSTTTDGAALSGGSGDLTDGVVAPGPWYTTENNAGTGPYVGWYWGGLGAQLNPTVTFHFAGSPTITSINVHMDHSFVGGVQAPAAILVDGVNTAFTPPGGGFGWTTLSGLNLTGGTHTLQFQQVPGWWVFVSEVTFDGTAVPEPASWAMMLAGFGLVGHALRSRRRGVVVA
jgi:hypothetical protein